MPVPKAVQTIGDAAEQLAVDTGIKSDGSKPAMPAAPATPDAEPAPAAAPKAEDWETRFKNYKAATDRTVADQRNQINQLQAQVTKLLDQNGELMKSVNAAGSANQGPEKTKEQSFEEGFEAYKANAAAEGVDVESYEQSWLKDQYRLYLMNLRAANGSATGGSDEKVAELENTVRKTATQMYEERLDAAFPNGEWESLTQSSDSWDAFCANRVSPYHAETYGDIVKTAHSNLDAAAVIRVLTDYKQTLNDGKQPKAEPADPLAQQITPEGGAGNDPLQDVNASTETFTLTQVNKFFSDRATTNKYSKEEADAIEKRIIAAQAAGKIIPG